MTHLYNCRHSGDQFRISKFDHHFDLISSYLCTEQECDCPAGHRPQCRHRQMVPKFIARGAVNTEWFFDYDRGGWVQSEIEPAPGVVIEEPATESAEYLEGLSQSVMQEVTVFNSHADPIERTVMVPVSSRSDAIPAQPAPQAPTTPVPETSFILGGFPDWCIADGHSPPRPHSPMVTTTGFDPVDDGSIPSVAAKLPTIRRRV